MWITLPNMTFRLINLGSYLEDGIHNAGKRPVVGVLWDSEDVQAPFVEILQFLGQQLLTVRLNTKPRDAAAGQRRPMGDLFDPADLRHQLLLLLLLLLPCLRCWWRDLHLILFVWGTNYKVAVSCIPMCLPPLFPLSSQVHRSPKMSIIL